MEEEDSQKRSRWRMRNVPECSLNPVMQMQEKALGKYHMVQKEKERKEKKKEIEMIGERFGIMRMGEKPSQSATSQKRHHTPLR